MATGGGGAGAGFGGAVGPGSISGGTASGGVAGPGVSATGADIGGDTGLTGFGAGFQGFLHGLVGMRGKFSAQDPAMLGKTHYGGSKAAGHAIGLVGTAATMGLNPVSLMSMLSMGKSMYGHAANLAALSGSSGGNTAPAGSFPGMDGGPSRQAQAGARTKKGTTPAPAPAPSAVTPYTETKEYLGGQRRIQGLRGEISKLGAELEAIRERRKALEPEARKMVGRIPLVHTELKGQEKGGGEVKALSKKGRERLLMSHSVPKGALRRASA